MTSNGFLSWYFNISSDTYGNGTLITNVLEAMQEKSDPVTIIRKDLSTEVINLSANQIKAFALVFSIAFPLVIIAIGIIVFVKRKNK